MKIAGADLTYCTNVHPGRDMDELLASITTHIVAVKQRVCPDAPFGLGLRLSNHVCRQLLEEPHYRQQLNRLLNEHRLYLFTVNGFIYGPFHGTAVKENVYRPDWSHQERLEYSNRLAKVTALLIPPGQNASISTVPIGLKSKFTSEPCRQRASEYLLEHILYLHRIEEASDRLLTLALEPEPGCYLETIADVVAFFEKYIYAKNTLERLAGKWQRSPEQCRKIIGRHLGICYDACHLAVMYQDPRVALAQLRQAQIPIHKVHISSALALKSAGHGLSPEQKLTAFVEPIYLHQVVEKCQQQMRYFPDLPEAIASLSQPRPTSWEWRIHFHVPIFLANLGDLTTTQSHLLELMACWRQQPFCHHFEVETYTWSVLPKQYRDRDISAAIAREIAWAMDLLAKSERNLR